MDSSSESSTRWFLSARGSRRVRSIGRIDTTRDSILKSSFTYRVCATEYPWSLWIWTSDLKGAGTDAQVFLQIYGESGKSDEIKLENNSDSFEQGRLDKFMVILGLV